MVRGCISTYGIVSLHICKGTINTERHTAYRFKRNRCRWCCCQKKPYIFLHISARKHTVAIETAWLHSRRARCWAGLPALKTFGVSWKEKYDRRPRTVEPLESSIRQEWDSVPLRKFQHPVSSVPKSSHALVKRKRLLCACKFKIGSCFFKWCIFLA